MNANKISLEEAQERLQEIHGSNIEILKYDSMSKNAKFLCRKCGHIWEVNARSVISVGHGCPKHKGDKISATKRFSLEEVIEYFSSLGIEYISGFYKNNSSKLIVKFPCGHSHETSLTIVKNGSRCRVCGKERSRLLQRKSLEVIESYLIESNLKLIGFPNGYINQNSIIEYECQFGHITSCRLSVFYRKHNCQKCTKIEMYKKRLGKGHPNWKGGLSDIFNYVKKNLIEWKKESMEFCNYKCVVTGDRFDDIHHLYSFNMILREALSKTKIEEKQKMGDYTEEEILLVIEETKNLHKKYPLGVCLRKDIHVLFHSLYGSGNNTPEQFYEFVDRIESGEIIINK